MTPAPLNPTPPKPDHPNAARTVVEVDFERGRFGTRLQGYRPDGSGNRHGIPLSTIADTSAGSISALALEFVSLLLGAASHQSVPQRDAHTLRLPLSDLGDLRAALEGVGRRTSGRPRLFD